jgi:hypothetical protein
VDSTGRETTFDPASPAGATLAIVDGANSLVGVACPSASVCVAVDTAGNEVTFDPASPAGAQPVAISAHGFTAVACPSTSRCAAVGRIDGAPTTGFIVTFDPASPSSKTTIQVTGEGGSGATLALIACPSVHQCTAEGDAKVVTFDPTSASGNLTPQGLPVWEEYTGLACPTANECVAVVTFYGNFGELVFDPASPGSGTQLNVDPGGGPVAIACVSGSNCTLVDLSGREVQFDPTSQAQPAVREVGPADGGFACPSASQCTSLDSVGDVVTFDPNSASIPAEIPLGLQALVCISPTSCTGVSGFGGGATFIATPSSLTVTASFTIEIREGMYWLSCPAANQCTAIDDGGSETTYDPSSNQGGTTRIISNFGFRGVACATTSQCVAVDGNGNALIFDPASPGSPTPNAVDAGQTPNAIVCPSATQCTVVDAAGGMVTFNPASIGSPTRHVLDSGNSLTDISCPSASQCTAIDSAMREVTFNPATGSGNVVALISGWNTQSSSPSIACPSPTQCTAFSLAGETTFNPVSVGAPVTVGLDGFLVGACAATTQCTAIDQQGREVTFNPNAPGKPKSDSIAAARQLSVVLAGGGTGTVKSSPAGVDCGATCAASFFKGTSVTLTARAQTGSTFTGWSGGGCSGTPTCQITIDGNATVTANFQWNGCFVPNVTGQPLATAKHAIVSNHCHVGTIVKKASTTVAKGSVISQSPAAGKRLKKGARVNLAVSKG